MSSIVVDTHILIWMLTNPSRLSADAQIAIKEAEDSSSKIYLSSISLVELRYLIEKSRFAETIYSFTVASIKDVDVPLTLSELSLEIANSLELIPKAIVPDMPDRIIAATALSLGLPLVFADHKIQALTTINVIW